MPPAKEDVFILTKERDLLLLLVLFSEACTEPSSEDDADEVDVLPPGSWAADGCRFSRADKVGAPVAASALLDGVGLLTLLLLDAGSTACALSLDEPAIAQGRCVGGVRLIMRIGGGGGRGSAPWESSPVHIEERSFRTPLGMLDTPIGLFGCASGGATSLLRPDKATSQHRQLPLPSSTTSRPLQGLASSGPQSDETHQSIPFLDL